MYNVLLRKTKIYDNMNLTAMIFNVNMKNEEVEQQTELMYKDNTIWTAVFNADKDAINRLIDADLNVIMSRGAVGDCPIHMLFLCGTDKHLKIARNLIRRFPTIMTQIYNKPKYYGENILHIAIVKRNLDMVKWLLSDIHSESNRQQLLTATATGDFFKIGQPTYYGETPLAFACCTNQWNIAKILLQHGADMNVNRIVENSTLVKQPVNLWNRLNNDNLTPLTLAADIGRSETLSWLLDERKKIQWSFGNVSCLLHPLDQLDVDIQEQNKKHSLCVLEIMIKNNDSKLVNPIIISLIDKKWSYFAYRILIRRFFFTFIYLLIFLATTILEQTRTEMMIDINNKTRTTYNKDSNMPCRIAYIIGYIIVISGALFKGACEIKDIYDLGWENYVHSTGPVFLEHLLSCSFSLCILIVQFLRLFKIPYENVIHAFACFLGWLYMFFFIMPFEFTGPLVIMIYKILFNDVLRFCIIYLIFLAGFSQSYFVLFNRNGLQGYLLSIKQCFLGLIEDFNLEYFIEEQHLCIGTFLLVLYVVIITILLLNLLIAMMDDTYTDVKRSATQLWHLERARIVLDIESEISISKRQSSINKYWVDIRGERYLQVEQVDDDVCLYRRNNN
ncbi:unnamed protein product [Rotaria sp. Silwood1]|nr:unnamed protein product [Rotaria sp. Silwood1]CAF1363096.1 unnamed protein product [Rotaria sp. Silwood1]